MNSKILEMFEKSTFSISKERYIYAKVKEIPPLSDHFMISKDKDEITVVTEEKNLSSLQVIEKNNNLWGLVSLNLYTPFMAGTLTAINSACAENGLNNLIISTYSRDYIIIKDSQVEKVKEVLKKLGFKEKSL
jgi:hypothetical protein